MLDGYNGSDGHCCQPRERSDGVSVTANTTGTFSESMNVSTLNTTHCDAGAAGQQHAGRCDGDLRRGDPDGDSRSERRRSSATTYTAKIKAGAAARRTWRAIALAADKVWTFTTASSDVTPPTVTTVSPTDAATGAGNFGERDGDVLRSDERIDADDDDGDARAAGEQHAGTRDGELRCPDAEGHARPVSVPGGEHDCTRRRSRVGPAARRTWPAIRWPLIRCGRSRRPVQARQST